MDVFHFLCTTVATLAFPSIQTRNQSVFCKNGVPGLMQRWAVSLILWDYIKEINGSCS